MEAPSLSSLVQLISAECCNFPSLWPVGMYWASKGVAGLVVRRAWLQELQVVIEEEARVATALHGHNVAELRQRMYVSDGGVALPAASQEPIRLLVLYPSVVIPPLALGFVPGAHPSVVFAAAPLPSATSGYQRAGAAGTGPGRGPARVSGSKAQISGLGPSFLISEMPRAGPEPLRIRAGPGLRVGRWKLLLIIFRRYPKLASSEAEREGRCK